MTESARLRLETTGFAHGGHAVARHEGRVVFVRHALPGEVVLAQVTRGGADDRFWFADAVSIERAAPGRVSPPCRYAGPGGCGGCDLQHADVATQRELKAGVVREQLSRLADLDRDVVVEPVPGDENGLRWRSRVEFAVDAAGRAGLRPFRSRDVLPIDDCLIARHDILDTGVLSRAWPGRAGVDAVAPSVGEPVLVPLVPRAPPREAARGSRRPGRSDRSGGERRRGRVVPPRPEEPVPEVLERVETPRWSGQLAVGARGFWQVHPGAASTFLARVLDALEPRPGESALDLYAGVGLFARALADLVGPGGRVTAVEGDREAVDYGRRDTASVRQLEWVAGDVSGALAPRVEAGQRADLVVLDPPRTGAGARVMAQVAALRPRAVAYVACDPAALARDLRALTDSGYELADLRAYDAFPMTHHVECIAVCVPSGGRPR